MTSQFPAPPSSLQRRVDLITPEMVRISQPIAGLGRRGLAFLVDISIRWGIPLMLFAMVRNLFPGAFLRIGWNWMWFLGLILGLFLVQFLYHMLFEALWNGQTPGKRLLGIRVVEEKGRPATLLSSAVRNLLRIVDAFPYAYGLGVILVFLGRRHQRIGDLAAGTLVVHEDRTRRVPMLAAENDAPTPAWITARHITLDVHQWERICGYLDRAAEMEPEPRRILGERLLADSLGSGTGDRVPADVPPFMAALQDLAAHPGLRGVTGRSAARFLRGSRGDWSRLEALVEQAERGGFRSLPAETLSEIGSLYRSVAADLAWARTHIPDTALEERLNNLVLRGHNLVYRGERTGLPELVKLYREEVPRAFRRNVGPVVVAACLFLVSMFASFVVSSIRPDVAEALVGRELLDRYVRQEKLWLDDFFNVVPGSVSASLIATNNISVTFFAFALGITLGAGTVYILVLNGVNLGATFAVCSAYGLGGELATFVVAHGLLEILCVLIAGGAGLVLGNAIISPGHLRRGQSLVQRGREAVILVLGTAPALVVAGLVEGYVSPHAWLPAWSKILLGVSLASLFLLWLSLGGRPRSPETAPARG